MEKVLIIEPIHEEGVKLLEQEVEVKIASSIDKNTIIKEGKDCSGLLIRTSNLPGEVIKGLPKLQVIGRHGAGVDNIDIKAATSQEVLIVNAPEANYDSVAEHVVTLMLGMAKNLLVMDKNVRNGNFGIRNNILGQEIKGKTIGILGLGKIGISLAKKIKSFDVNIIAYDPYVKKSDVSKYGIEMVDDTDIIYRKSDFITLHVPLTEKTENMIGEEEFKKMKSDAFLINTSRGPVVDENALYEALKNDVIKGAGIDVYSQEPPENNNPLFELENLILSPHNAALTEEAMVNMATHVAQGMIDFYRNRKPKYIVNPSIYNEISNSN